MCQSRRSLFPIVVVGLMMLFQNGCPMCNCPHQFFGDLKDRPPADLQPLERPVESAQPLDMTVDVHE
jgi:hypothetical protein